MNESLSRLSFDISNATGLWTNQTGFAVGQFYDTNLLNFTTNWFQCYDIALTNGFNTITVHATDLAGNQATTSATYTLDLSGDTNPPVLTMVWPQDGIKISGTQFTLRALVDDATANVAASVRDTNGVTNTVSALVERDGQVWGNDLPLGNGTNQLTVTATDAAGNSSVTNLIVVKNDVGLTIDSLASDQFNKTLVNVNGNVGSATYAVTVNGISAAVNPDGSWAAANVPVSASGTADLNVQVYDSSSNLLASQTSDLPQPVTVGLMSYSGTSQDVYNNSGGGNGYSDYKINWSYLLGGTFFYHGVLMNQGEDDFDYTESDPLSSGADAYSAPWGSEYVEVATTFDDHVGTTGTWVNHARTRVMLEPQGQKSPNQIATYLVRAKALERSDPYNDDFGFGNLPLPPEWLQINGQTLINTGITNEDDGAVWGETLVQGPAGAYLDVTPVATQVFANKDYTFDVQAQETPFKIVDGTTGLDLPETNTVIVGQQIDLDCKLELTNATLTNFQWTIPGQTVKQYEQLAEVDVTNSYTIKEDLENPDLSSNSISYYWINGGTNLEVDCTAMFGNAHLKARTWFNVNRPTSTLVTETTTNTPSVSVETNSVGGLVLQFGSLTNNSPPGPWGIKESFTVTTPINGTGSFGYLQIIDETTRRWILDDTNNTAQKLYGTNLLDTLPYQYLSGLTSIGNSDTQSNISADSPGQALYGEKWASANDQFTGYLMYRPAGDTNHTIWVTLREVHWSWSGAATKDTNGIWTLDPGYPPPPVNPVSADSVTLPTWYGTQFSLQTEPDN